jgi:hypothetical protein
VKMWYPSDPLVLASNSYQDLGEAPIPSACKVPKSLGSKAVEIVSETTRLDIIYGEYETTKRATFVAQPYGLMCSNVSDTLQTYYDYAVLTLESKPLTTTVSVTTIGLQKATLAKGAANATFGGYVPLDAHLFVSYAARRLQRERAIFNALLRVRKNK